MNVMVDGGLDLYLRMLLNREPEVGLSVRLYSSDTTPTHMSVAEQFVEVVAPGYAPISFTPAAWYGSTTGGSGTYSYPSLDFIFSPNPNPPTVVGYFVVATQLGRLMWAGRFARPHTPPTVGGTIKLNMDIVGRSTPT